MLRVRYGVNDGFSPWGAMDRYLRIEIAK
jgi:hypothetical protein